MNTTAIPTQVDAVIVGAGFSGLYMLKRLKELGLSAIIMEQGSDVGGTWYWNRYPGARCDVESPYYSYSFDAELEQEWDWNERYPAQDEIQAYLSHVADRYNLRDDIYFNSTVAAASYDDAENLWSVSTLSDGSGHLTTAKYCIMATGCLSASRLPDIQGIDQFEGDIYHTAQWPKDGVDFSGQKVAVIGTGSSGVQAIPEIAKEASELYVFQRTPNFSVPAENGPLDQKWWQEVKDNYREVRDIAKATPTGLPFHPPEELATQVDEDRRQEVFENHWTTGGFRLGQCFGDLAVDADANEHLANFIRGKIDDIVTDPKTAELLKPYDHPVGTKRITVGTNYYETFNREQVQLLDARHDPIDKISATGVNTATDEYQVDAIVFATGFDAMTGSFTKMDIRGREDKSLREHWEAGPKTYLGISVSGFPNMFILAGPGSPSVLTNMVTAIEQHVDWVHDHIEHMEKNQLAKSEAKADSEEEWVDHVNAVSEMTLMHEANSWYLGANVPGKPRVFMPYAGGMAGYRQICDDVAAEGYKGFQLV